MQQQFDRDNTEESVGETLKAIVSPWLGDNCAQYQSVLEPTFTDLGSQRRCLRRKQQQQQQHRTSITKPQRLPANVLPKHYELEFKPDFELFTFKGKTSIDILFKADTSIIILNAVDIVIEKAELSLACYVVPIKRLTYAAENETVIIELSKELPASTVGKLCMDYFGKLNEEMKGFFHTKYISKHGQESCAVLTHFEPNYARNCFPCWDEPSFKATYDIHLIVPRSCVALSNMPIRKLEPVGRGNQRVFFERTPSMSTYLLAMGVGEYDHVECRTEMGVMVRVFVPNGKKEQAWFALVLIAEMLAYFRSYFNMDFPLPKLDLVAIADFAAGAMANWGLIICREAFVNFDTAHTSPLCKQAIALTLGQVIAQQWFGGLVTMEWWTYLWLIEAFPAFMKYECVDELFPEFDIWTQFITGMYTRALGLDSLRGTQPVQSTIKQPCELNEVFDELSYNKSVCLVRMLQAYIGKRHFCKGMKLYLERHQYRSTCKEDLWAALQQVSLKPIAELMLTWTRRKGYPLVKVTALQMGTKRLLKLTQTRFTCYGAAPDRDYTWHIPISIMTARVCIAKTYLMNKKHMEIVLDDIGENDWVKLNAGSIGYYRTNYSEQMLAELMPAVSNMELPTIDRLGLLDDLFAMLLAARASTADYLHFIESYQHENDYIVWAAITNSLLYIQVLVSHTNLMDNFEFYGEKLYTPVAACLGWQPQPAESVAETRLRGLVLLRLVTFHAKDYVTEAQKLFPSLDDDAVSFNADMRFVCYKALLQDATDEMFHRMLTLYSATAVEEDQTLIARALGCMSNVTLLRLLLRVVMSGHFHGQDPIIVMISIALNPNGRDLMWQYFKENYVDIIQLCPSEALFVELIKNLIENFATAARAQEVGEFFHKQQFPGTKIVVSQALEKIRFNAAWLKRDLETLTVFLQRYQRKK